MKPTLNKIENNDSDQALISRYLAGELASFRQLYDRYQQGIYFLTRRYFKNSARAEEVYQDVFLKVIRKLRGYQHTGSFKSWLYTLCRNHCIDIIRADSRDKSINASDLTAINGEDDESLSVLDMQADTTVNTEEDVYHNELDQHLNTALSELPLEQKETFILKEKSGMTFEEIAEATDVSVNTAKSRMRYALSTLRRCLQGKDFFKELQS